MGSEFERFSLSAKNITEPVCLVEFDRPHDPTYLSNKDTSAKTNQANGTHISRECDGTQPVTEGNAYEHTAAFSPNPLDSPLNSTDTTLDTTGDITVEDNPSRFLNFSERDIIAFLTAWHKTPPGTYKCFWMSVAFIF
ncbi:lethal(2) giant larvae protein homolog 1-like [Pyxicephalus adspersus]|uniref:lethal(2) giant larvae protein homolog 1-like n=1 Tax=Pyxicephalus adspersus TaxID=30357 RepID=UPI003B5937D0